MLDTESWPTAAFRQVYLGAVVLLALAALLGGEDRLQGPSYTGIREVAAWLDIPASTGIALILGIPAVLAWFEPTRILGHLTLFVTLTFYWAGLVTAVLTTPTATLQAPVTYAFLVACDAWLLRFWVSHCRATGRSTSFVSRRT